MNIITPEDEGYIKPQVALDLIVHYAGSEYQAKNIISDALRSGKINCMAQYVWRSDRADIREEWKPVRCKNYEFWKDQHFTGAMFAESLQWPKDTTFWKWEKAEFVILMSDEFSDRQIYLFMKNIRLLKSDVLGLVGRSSRSGGPKSDRERWALFWINILYDFTKNNFDWTVFDSPQDLKNAFVASNDSAEAVHTTKGPFNENNIDFAVEIAWEHLVKRAAGSRLRADGRARVDL